MTQAQSTRTPTIDATIVRNDEGQPCELRLVFANGELLSMGHGTFSAEMQMECLYHGLKQKLVDAAAISRNTDTGQSATVADKFEAVKEVYDRLLAGEWNKRRGDGEGSGSLLLRALLVLKPEKTREQLETYLSGLTKAQQAALRANPKVAAVIETLRTKPAAGVDTDAMLDAI